MHIKEFIKVTFAAAAARASRRSATEAHRIHAAGATETQPTAKPPPRQPTWAAKFTFEIHRFAQLKIKCDSGQQFEFILVYIHRRTKPQQEARHDILIKIK